MQFYDITNQRFGRLVAIRRAETIKKNTRWECLCDCGNTVVVRYSALSTGSTKSCGCYNLECRQKRARHEHARQGHISKTYYTYQSMKDRCTNPRNTNYRNYGGRGITVCGRWLESFSNFLEDMGEKPKGFTLERIDNDAGYSPDNCKWATETEQRRNKRVNVQLTFNGKTQVVRDWETELGFDSGIVGYRIRIGWSVEKALTTPVETLNHRKRKLTWTQAQDIREQYAARKTSRNELAARYSVSLQTISNIINLVIYKHP